MRNKIIAIDFDGTLCTNAFPKIGEPKQSVIDAILREQKNGVNVILWTCRVGERLIEAVKFCNRAGIIFDAVNENVPAWIEFCGGDTRKVFADEYWDDKAVLY